MARALAFFLKVYPKPTVLALVNLSEATASGKML